jgi:hypothetical protein
MALTLVTNPVGSAASKFFAGFQKCEVVFKREDLAVIDIEAGTGGAKINHAGDLSSLLAAGDIIFIHSAGVNYTYNGSFEILTIVAGEITINTPYIESATGGYINYLKNWFLELQCVHPTLPDVNLLPFSLESDGDAAGNVVIDVSIINELNIRRSSIIAQGAIPESSVDFEIKYREVYAGSSNAFTLVDNKLFIIVHAINTPNELEILNHFDEPHLYLGYPSALVIANKAMTAGSDIQLNYNELNINKAIISSDNLGVVDSDVNSLLLWKWHGTATVDGNTKYIEFEIDVQGVFDFKDPDFDYPDFVTQ